MLLYTFPLLIGGIVDNVKLGVNRQLGDGEEHVLLLLHVQVQEGVGARGVHPSGDVSQADTASGLRLRVQYPDLQTVVNINILSNSTRVAL